jgi:hypothetical protein
MSQRIADGFCQIRGSRDTSNVLLQPGMQGLHNRSTSCLPHLLSMFGGMAADLRFDGIQRAELRQHRGGQRRLRGSMELVERSPQVRPAEGERHRGVGAIPGQPLEPGIAVDLQHTTEVAQVGGGADVLAVFCIDIGRDRMTGSAPSRSDPPEGCQRS